MGNKNVPGVDNLLNNEPTRINTVQIANDREPSGTKNNELEPIQIRTGWHELIRKVVTNQYDLMRISLRTDTI